MDAALLWARHCKPAQKGTPVYTIKQSDKWPWSMRIEDSQGRMVAFVDLLEWSTDDTQEAANRRNKNMKQREVVERLVRLANIAEEQGNDH